MERFLNNSSNELAANRNLQFFFLFSIFISIFTFSEWRANGFLSSQSVDSFTHVCPPYFQSCDIFYIFGTLPESYDLNILYFFLGIFIFVSIFYFFKTSWRIALLWFIPIVIFKLAMVYLLSYSAIGNYTVIEGVAALIIIFSKNKVFFLKILLSFMYLASAMSKLYPSYLEGNLFKALSAGMPFVPDLLLSFLPFLLITSLLLVSILIWHPHEGIRSVAFGAIVLFHLYTMTLVGYRFPLVSLMLILVIYFSSFESFSLPKLFSSKPTLFVMSILIAFQLIPLVIKGNEHITGEGERYGLYIFNTNKQCAYIATIQYRDGSFAELADSNTFALSRCDPYTTWFTLKQRCLNTTVDTISLKYSVSLNGANFRIVVDEVDVCRLEYSAFKHNDWLHDSRIDSATPVYKNSLYKQ